VAQTSLHCSPGNSETYDVTDMTSTEVSCGAVSRLQVVKTIIITKYLCLGPIKTNQFQFPGLMPCLLIFHFALLVVTLFSIFSNIPEYCAKIPCHR
jgi:hypothetical protein